jgi:hypothetical protein
VLAGLHGVVFDEFLAIAVGNRSKIPSSHW